jgi:ubiquitin-like-conjugating enzyme ATG3
MPSLLSNLKSAREYLSPTLKTSAFLTRGVLTPSEFVAAGDELVYKCPTWSWEAGDPDKRKKHLPDDKQYLVTRGVPCKVRVGSLENVVADLENDGDDDGEWLVSRILSDEELKRREDQALLDDFDLLEDEVHGKLKIDGAEDSNKDQQQQQQQQQEEDEYADMADFEDDNVMQDEAAAITPHNSTNSNILKVRTYDLSITYDKYYQTPRIYLMGYSDDTGSPLTGEEMMQDVIKDYANKTVTMEHHPHVSGIHASIHPCQHGAVMKTIVKNLQSAESEEGPSVEMYLFIFLKFVSSMIPTINYDFTMDVSASTKK